MNLPTPVVELKKGRWLWTWNFFWRGGYTYSFLPRLTRGSALAAAKRAYVKTSGHARVERVTIDLEDTPE